jgi:hypothetical protein
MQRGNLLPYSVIASEGTGVVKGKVLACSVAIFHDYPISCLEIATLHSRPISTSGAVAPLAMTGFF